MGNENKKQHGIQWTMSARFEDLDYGADQAGKEKSHMRIDPKIKHETLPRSAGDEII